MDAFDMLDEALEGLGVGTESLDKTVENLAESGKEAGVVIHNTKTDKEKVEKIFYGLNEFDRSQAVYECLIPASYKNAVFDVNKIRTNLIKRKMKTTNMYTIHKFNKYTDICTGILSAIRMKKLPKRSYLIGAPNGFGKTSFVIECLVTLRRQGFKVAPYISLLELYHLKTADEQRMMNPFYYKKAHYEDGKISDEDYIVANENKGIAKSPEIVTGRYSFSEYINADCLFVSLSGIESKIPESNMLYQLLNIRGAKGLPTIVMMSTALEPYMNDAKLRHYVWNEIMCYDKDDESYDRLYHISCYTLPHKSKIDTKDLVIEEETNIVLGE